MEMEMPTWDDVIDDLELSAAEMQRLMTELLRLRELVAELEQEGK
jgi:hypothetical protein